MACLRSRDIRSLLKRFAKGGRNLWRIMRRWILQGRKLQRPIGKKLKGLLAEEGLSGLDGDFGEQFWGE